MNKPRLKCVLCGFVTPWGPSTKGPFTPFVGLPHCTGRAQIEWTKRPLLVHELDIVIARVERALGHLNTLRQQAMAEAASNEPEPAKSKKGGRRG